MKKINFSVLLCSLALAANAQTAQKANPFPLGQYEELTDTKPHDTDAAWAKISAPTQFSWASTDVRYRRNDKPHGAAKHGVANV